MRHSMVRVCVCVLTHTQGAYRNTSVFSSSKCHFCSLRVMAEKVEHVHAGLGTCGEQMV